MKSTYIYINHAVPRLYHFVFQLQPDLTTSIFLEYCMSITREYHNSEKCVCSHTIGMRYQEQRS